MNQGFLLCILVAWFQIAQHYICTESVRTVQWLENGLVGMKSADVDFFWHIPVTVDKNIGT